MARFGTFKFDTSILYGLNNTTTALLWTFLVKWNGTNYDGFNEGRRMIDLTVSRGRDTMVGRNGAGWERYPPGTATAILDNTDGRYSPYNTASPLYPYVTPGKFAYLKVMDGSGGSNYNIMYGQIADIQPYSKGNRQLVAITIIDGLQWLANREVRIGLRQSVSVSSAILNVLNNSGFPQTEWAYSSAGAGETLTYEWHWIKNALDSIHEMEDHDAGAFLHDRFGSMVWFPGSYTHSGTVTVDQSELLTDISIPQPWEVVRNKIAIKAYPKILDPVNTTIWELGDVPAIAAGASMTFDMLFRYNFYEPCGSSVAFNHTTNAAADGSGANLTASCPLTYDTQIGDGATVTIANNSGSTAYVTLLRAVGNVIYAPYASTLTAEDTTSQGLYGTRVFNLNGLWMQSTTYGKQYADWVLSNLKDPKKFPVIRIENRTSLQFARDIYRDRVTLNAAALGISGELFRIGKVEHRWLRETGQAVQTTWKLEPYLTAF